jgi:hypothetical protein
VLGNRLCGGRWPTPPLQAAAPPRVAGPVAHAGEEQRGVSAAGSSSDRQRVGWANRGRACGGGRGGGAHALEESGGGGGPVLF